jgi:hypothetical protein
MYTIQNNDLNAINDLKCGAKFIYLSCTCLPKKRELVGNM